MLQFTEQQFKEVKEKGEELYKSLNEVYCPYFKEKIVFNAQGLEHLKFKRRDKARLEQDQFMRFKLLHIVPDILKLSDILQGIFETKKFERLRVHNRTDVVLQSVTYYEFIAVTKRNRIKIVIKQIEGGKKI